LAGVRAVRWRGVEVAADPRSLALIYAVRVKSRALQTEPLLAEQPGDPRNEEIVETIAEAGFDDGQYGGRPSDGQDRAVARRQRKNGAKGEGDGEERDAAERALPPAGPR